MTADVYPAWQPFRAAVAGGERTFPVRNVYGVTRNYAAGSTRTRVHPAIIAKSPHWLAGPGATVPYPQATEQLEPEIELVVAIGEEVRGISEDAAWGAIYGYAVGLDMTRRDLQNAARKKRDPLDAAKWFEGATPLSQIAPAADIGHPDGGAITLDVNGTRAQEGDLARMIWKSNQIVALLAKHFTLMPGDVILTGTPPGEIVLKPGDLLDARIEGVGSLQIGIGKPQ